MLPWVQDLIAGLGAAGVTQAPSLKPPAGISRPPLPFSPSAWPPRAGVYTSDGRITQDGVLSALGMALTYDEVRAWVLGLTQPTEPSASQAAQIWLAARTLAAVLFGLDLKERDYRHAWERVFGGSMPAVISDLAFTGQTADATSQAIGDVPTTSEGTYVAAAICGIQRDSGQSGSLRIAGTFSRFADSLTLVRSDRTLAQLSPTLVGVRADFQAMGNSIQLVVSGKAAMKLTWVNRLTIYPPIGG